MSDYDLIIRGGLIVDGSGAEPFVGDVAVKDGTICEVRPTVKGSADREVDASGKTVTPGFVDVHTHYDGQATWDNHLNPSSALGTTTISIITYQTSKSYSKYHGSLYATCAQPCWRTPSPTGSSSR